MTVLVRTSDGRRVAVEERGDPDGSPVFLLHGTPGSRVGPAPRPQVLYHLGVRLITFDRPGYGRSDRQKGRAIASIAADVADIADALGIGRFAVAGRSGGAPHALACAALLPDRITRVAALVGLAPPRAEGLDWFKDMAPANVREYTIGRGGSGPVAASLAAAAAQLRADPAGELQVLAKFTAPDRRTVADFGIRTMMVDNFAEALRDSADGWVDDIVAFCSDWSFDPAVITVPTLLWHGADDVYSPVGHAHWLGRRIPGAILRIEHGTAHFGAIDILPEVLLWLVREQAD